MASALVSQPRYQSVKQILVPGAPRGREPPLAGKPSTHMVPLSGPVTTSQWKWPQPSWLRHSASETDQATETSGAGSALDTPVPVSKGAPIGTLRDCSAQGSSFGFLERGGEGKTCLEELPHHPRRGLLRLRRGVQVVEAEEVHLCGGFQRLQLFPGIR